MSEPARYVVDSIESKAQHMFRDLGIMEGDTIEVPGGFPPAHDLPEPGEPVTLLRELHPNVAWFLGSSADEGTLIDNLEQLVCLPIRREVWHPIAPCGGSVCDPIL